MLRHPAARAGGDERRGRGDVERRPPAAGPGRVDEVAAGLDRHAPARASCARARRSPRPSPPSCAARSGTPAVWMSEAPPSMISRRHGGGLVGAQGLAAARRSIAGGERRVRHRGSCAVAACRPPVSTDSGWNWTPSAGSSRWRRPMITSPVRAETSSVSGRSRVDDQRVVATGHERGFEAREDRPAVVLDLGGLAVHRLAAHDLAAEGRRERLVAEADAEHRRAAPPRSGGSPRPTRRPRRACTAPARRSPRSGARSSSSSTSLRTTSSSAPSSPRYCTRLYVNES